MAPSVKIMDLSEDGPTEFPIQKSREIRQDGKKHTDGHQFGSVWREILPVSYQKHDYYSAEKIQSCFPPRMSDF